MHIGDFEQYGMYEAIRSNMAETIASFYWNCVERVSLIALDLSILVAEQLLVKKLLM